MYMYMHLLYKNKRAKFQTKCYIQIYYVVWFSSFLKAIYNFEGSSSFELKLSVGDTVQILEECSGQ